MEVSCVEGGREEGGNLYGGKSEMRELEKFKWRD